MSSTYWSVQDCAWVPCDGQQQPCADPLSAATPAAVAPVEVPVQREPVVNAVDA